MGRLPAENGLRAIVIDPSNPRQVYAAGQAGLYRSTDAGQSWQPAAAGLPPGGLQALALDSRLPRRLYAATPAGALYRSEDGAGSWQALAGAESGAGR